MDTIQIYDNEMAAREEPGCMGMGVQQGTARVGGAESAALEVLRSTGVDILEAAIVAKAALAVGRGRVKRAQQCLALGEQELRRRERTVTFARAVEEALAVRGDRRRRTVVDFRYICNRLMRSCKGLAKRRVRCMTAEECAGYLQEAFGTPRQRNKARLILSGVFSTAVRRGWCAENPMRRVAVERVVEKRIEILSEEEIARLLEAAQVHAGGSCLPAVGMMLYAGIRPHECERLRWEDVRLPSPVAEAPYAETGPSPVAGASYAETGPAPVAEAPYAETGPAPVAGAPCAEAGPTAVAGAPYTEASGGVIYISPQHSKTGGARCVTIHPPLARILQREQKAGHERICPPNWRRLWAALHRAAGFAHWQPDVLRHTFATHHLATFRSYAELQLEMGHRSAELLRTRYVTMEGIMRYAPGESMLVG